MQTLASGVNRRDPLALDHDSAPAPESHVTADQSAAEAFLGAPETHGGAAVQRIDTHIGMVFIAGARAYKLKRAVKFPYLDFSTLAQRRAACEREVAINRRTAPEVYLEARPIVRGADGNLSFGDAGAAPESVVDWVVAMNAFAQDGLFDRMAQEGRLSDALLAELAGEIFRFHDGAEVITRDLPNRGGANGMAVVVEENAIDFAERPDLFDADVCERLNATSQDTIARLTPLLEDRFDRGLVRHCHGDLHLRNICLVEGRPRLFDAIEFSDAIASIDVLYDLAFLLMDLDHRGMRAAANLLFNRYLARAEEEAGLAALPLFLSARAAIRAKVNAAAAASQADAAARERLEAEARAYFAAAQAYLAPPAARLVAVGGLSGTGKSTLARVLAPGLGPVPGALHLRSDAIRKALFGVEEEESLPPKAYRPAVSVRVYDEVLRRARVALAAGHAVIVDAVYAKAETRAEVEAVAGDAAVAFTGLWLEARPETMFARADARRADASDATSDVVRQQMGGDTGAIAWHRVDAERPVEEVAAAARRILQG